MAVLPLYDALVLPDATVYLKTERFVNMTGRAPRMEERVTLLILKEEQGRKDLNQDSFYPIGASGFVSEIHEEGWFAVKTRGRVNLDEIAFSPDGRIEAYTSRRVDTDELPPQENKRKTREAKQALMDFSKGTQWEAASRPWLDQFDTLSDVAAACAPWMDATHEEKYAILAEDSAVRRAEMLEKLIYETLEMGKLSQEGSSIRMSPPAVCLLWLIVPVPEQHGRVYHHKHGSAVMPQRPGDRGQHPRGGQRHRRDVDDHSGNDIGPDLLHDFFRQAEKIRDTLDVIAHEHRIRGLDGDVAADASHGDPGVRRRHRERVVHAVADHADGFIAPAAALDYLHLFFRQEI